MWVGRVVVSAGPLHSRWIGIIFLLSSNYLQGPKDISRTRSTEKGNEKIAGFGDGESGAFRDLEGWEDRFLITIDSRARA